MYEKVTAFLPILYTENLGKWVEKDELEEDYNNDGSSKQTFRTSIRYTSVVYEFSSAVGVFVEDHKEMDLYNYIGILENANIWGTEAMGSPDVSSLNGKTVMALIVSAIRAERFCDGALRGRLESGDIAKWLARLEEIDMGNLVRGQKKMGAVVFCNITWMKDYRGITDSDQPSKGGSWVKENNDAMEKTNFLPINGKCYGYVMHRGQLHIERLDRTATKTNVLDDVTVVWVATNDTGRKIVGWYENAIMCRDWQNYEDDYYYIDYNFRTDAKNAYLIPVGLRDFSVPSSKPGIKGSGMGQSQVWYADSEFGRSFVVKTLKYLEEMKPKCRLISFSPEELRKATNIPGKTSKELLALATETSDEGEYLKSLQICNQAQALEEAPGAFVRVCRALNLEMLFCYDEAIEVYKDALENVTEDEYEAFVDVDAKKKLSRLYRLTGKNFLAWHLEEEIFLAYKESKNNAGMVESLLEMMSIAEEEQDFGRLEKIIGDYDVIGTKLYADDVKSYRNVLKKKG